MVTSMKPGDSMLLHAETDTQYQHMIGVLILDPSTAPDGFDVDTLMAVSEKMVVDAPSYRMKLVDSPLAMDTPMLAEDPDFKLRNHVYHIACPAPGGQQELTELVGDIASRPLSRTRPMWENWIVSGLEGGYIAMVSKTHHCLQDGVGGVEVMAEMFDLEPDPPKKPNRKKASVTRKPKPPAPLDIMREAYKAHRERPSMLSAANKAVRTLLKRRDVLANVTDAELLAPSMSEAPRLFFNGQLSSYRSVAMGSLSLPKIKQLKNAYGITLNDTVLAIVGIAIREYLEEHNDYPGESLACSVPVSLSLNHTEGASGDEGNNQVGLMNVRLPIEIEDPAEMALTINQCATASKEVFAQSGEDISKTIISSLPPRLAATGLGILSDTMMAKNPLGNLGVSNIPGPSFPLYMRGAKVVANYPMGPVPNGVGLGITLMSYLDRIDFTLQGCREKMPDIARLAELMDEAVEKLFDALPEESKQSKKSNSKKSSTSNSSKKKKPAPAKKAPRAKKAATANEEAETRAEANPEESSET